MTEQACGKCRLVDVCYKPSLNSDAVVTNILVCRLERRIDVEKTTKSLLEILNPKILNVTAEVVAITKEAHNDVYHEAQGVVIEALMGYTMGQRFHPLRWLFGHKTAAVSRWIWRKLRDAKRAKREFSYHAVKQISTEQPIEQAALALNKYVTNHKVQSMLPGLLLPPKEYDEHYEQECAYSHAFQIVEDGRTLTLEEYRVLRFCLTNSITDGFNAVRLHRQLRAQWQVSRSRVSTAYSSACRRLIEAMGLLPSFLATRDVQMPNSMASQTRRRISRHRKPASWGLSERETVLLLDELEKGRATVMDLAYAYGLSYSCVAALKRRRGDRSL